MPDRSTYCNDNLVEFYYAVITERYEALGDDEDEKEEKQRLRTLAASDSHFDLESFITEHMANYETISINLQSAILGSIDYDKLQEDLNEWAADLDIDEEEEELCKHCGDWKNILKTCYKCKCIFCKNCGEHNHHIIELDEPYTYNYSSSTEPSHKKTVIRKTYGPLCDGCKNDEIKASGVPMSKEHLKEFVQTTA
jgi:hypothetical protein